MNNVNSIIKMMKAEPHYQREAFHRWARRDGAEGQALAMYQSDSLAAREAYRGLMDTIYREMAVEQNTGIAALAEIPDFLIKKQA